ncbi:MAG: GGDEF domain-containing protein [Leptothrix sp. (in: Bacteria)]|nr:GGDEF domain-containing protein [Leptothrix sp. (in: b-proteobacteria)]
MPCDDLEAQPAPADRSTLTWDQPTVRLSQGQVALAQSLGDRDARQACLVLYSGPAPGQRYALAQGTLALGRAPDCQVQLDSPGISRRHAEFAVSDDSVRLRDLGSVNGTHVNERRIDGSVLLRDGDMLRLGDVMLKYYPRDSLDALLHDRIYRLATVDELTEVFTRRYVMDTLAREYRRARRGARALSVLCLDLDHFKDVNDRWGHAAGDQVLHEAAATLHGALRGSDILGRTGGEEFLAVLPGTPPAEAQVLAERLRAALAARTLALRAADGSEHAHRQTVSVGMASLGPGTAGVRELLAAADASLYEAKRAGRNRVAG